MYKAVLELIRNEFFLLAAQVALKLYEFHLNIAHHYDELYTRLRAQIRIEQK